jgi:hypothetical protein
MHADDTSVLLTADNEAELKNKITYMLDYMTGWFLVNGLVLNMDKTNIMKFTQKFSNYVPKQTINWNK